MDVAFSMTKQSQQLLVVMYIVQTCKTSPPNNKSYKQYFRFSLAGLQCLADVGWTNPAVKMAVFLKSAIFMCPNLAM